jgi:hypothetical protein
MCAELKSDLFTFVAGAALERAKPRLVLNLESAR